jgi:hypothetical protein
MIYQLRVSGLVSCWPHESSRRSGPHFADHPRRGFLLGIAAIEGLPTVDYSRFRDKSHSAGHSVSIWADVARWPLLQAASYLYSAATSARLRAAAKRYSLMDSAGLRNSPKSFTARLPKSKI